ncbi:hypothetical protein [Mycobacteroides abscessus]|uniref:hypothetical protein n=1 Tax=Mycobacteroides abscessus TaxID=36809 RepID=UPI000929BF77|nr:hypothetical protein [Mycobacteroides abscessus]DAZ90259.1 TPA_asm: hypothetical protein PROPHIFSIL01-1_72 [Mycobacterium phage prophiFSIL01-1]SHZ92953.1 Uncharacterised protein [Mycobacteroides abscessus subsp. abscessus]SIA06852.1 Uncharacterised protein [Mycobacteroides abscessus subsp. abscessus]SIA64834.1 Uncharacterised protein [Mycobacteroides abscessus subsp. abscessus]SIA69861.1 Uncharacterised protein [Mycobacteroides abscessus subsp. abscessus]
MNPRSLGKSIVTVALEAAQEYFEERPELLDKLADRFADILTAKIAAALPKIIDNMTNVTPWKIDDVVLDGLAQRLANLLPSFLPDFLRFKRP